MLNIIKIDNSDKSITFSFVNSAEGREIMEVVINSIVSSHFGHESNEVREWVRLSIPLPDKSTLTKTFRLKAL